MIDRPAILLMAGGAVFAAILIAELRPSAHDDPRVAPVARSHDHAPVFRAERAPPERLIETIVARPLFDPTRRPPVSVETPNQPVERNLSGKRLTGIVTAPDHRLAIFAVAGGKPITVSEGEAVDGWQIEAIKPQQVSLRGPDGAKVLQPKPDPNQRRLLYRRRRAVPRPPRRPNVPPGLAAVGATKRPVRARAAGSEARSPIGQPGMVQHQ